MPWMSSPTRVVITVTPVAKRPARRRYSRGSIGCGWPFVSLTRRRLRRRRDRHFVPVEEVADALLQRLLVVAEVEGAHHPDGVAEEVAFVEFLPPAEAGAGDVPRQPVEPHALLAAR